MDWMGRFAEPVLKSPIKIQRIRTCNIIKLTSSKQLEAGSPCRIVVSIFCSIIPYITPI